MPYGPAERQILIDAAYKAGFRGEGLINAVASAMAESSSFAARKNDSIEDSRGPWQVNVRAHPEYANVDLTDPYLAAQAAFKISSGGTDFSPWTVWKGGDRAPVRQYIEGVRQAVPNAAPDDWARQAPSSNASAVGPEGRTFSQVTGTVYQSDAERAWYLAQRGTTPTGSQAPPPTNPTPQGGMTMDPSVAKWLAIMYPGKKYADLVADEKTGLEIMAHKYPVSAPSLGSESQTTTVIGADGKEHRMQYNPETKRYDIDMGVSATASATAANRETTIQGADGKLHRILIDAAGNTVKDLGEAAAAAPLTAYEKLMQGFGNISARIGGQGAQTQPGGVPAQQTGAPATGGLARVGGGGDSGFRDPRFAIATDPLTGAPRDLAGVNVPTAQGSMWLPTGGEAGRVAALTAGRGGFSGPPTSIPGQNQYTADDLKRQTDSIMLRNLYTAQNPGLDTSRIQSLMEMSQKGIVGDAQTVRGTKGQPLKVDPLSYQTMLEGGANPTELDRIYGTATGFAGGGSIMAGAAFPNALAGLDPALLQQLLQMFGGGMMGGAPAPAAAPAAGSGANSHGYQLPWLSQVQPPHQSAAAGIYQPDDPYGKEILHNPMRRLGWRDYNEAAGWNSGTPRPSFLDEPNLPSVFQSKTPAVSWNLGPTPTTPAPPAVAAPSDGRMRDPFAQPPPMMAGGGQMVTREPIVGVGAQTGQPQFVVGEPQYPGGPPAPERLNVQPLTGPNAQQGNQMGQQDMPPGYAPIAGPGPQMGQQAGPQMGGQPGPQAGQQQQPQNPLTNIAVLQALARGINRRVRLQLPAVA